MVGRVTVVNLMNYGCGNGAGCFEVKVWVFVENKTKVASGVREQSSEIIKCFAVSKAATRV